MRKVTIGPWTMNLWAVRYMRGREVEIKMLGCAWDRTASRQKYAGEPIRALLFDSMKAARAWCRQMNEAEKAKPSRPYRYRFIPYQVRQIYLEV